MNVFISSLITGMEPIRAVAREAVDTLGLTPVMAEDFGARPQSPQIACLDGVRRADAVVLILGPRYGATQPSGLSATHEEYREAKQRCPALVFVQEGVAPEPAQAAFIREVQEWSAGLFRAGFSDPESLRKPLTRALHQWQIAKATGPLDVRELVARANSMLPDERDHRHQGTVLTLVLAAGPAQAVLRPSQLEDRPFGEMLQREALFGPSRIFSTTEGSSIAIEDHKLVLQQPGSQLRMLALDGQGGIVIQLPIRDEERFFSVIVEEVVRAQLAAALGYAIWLLNAIDPTERLTHVVPGAQIAAGHFMAWRTQREQDASPNQVTLDSRGQDERLPVFLAPPHRTRAALRLETGNLIDDLIVLLRRQWR
jgi:hypothetical protein